MTTFSNDLFSTWIDTRNEHTSGLNSQQSRSTQDSSNQSDSQQSLVFMDDTLLKDLELDVNFATQLDREVEKTRKSPEILAKQDFNTASFFDDDATMTQATKDCDFIDWNTTILEKKDFKKLHTDINDELNDSVNFLKKKLFDKSNDVVPVKRRSLGHNKTDDAIKYPFYGLPNKVKELFKIHKGIDKLYEWQTECLSMKAVKDRKNLIYALPTSGGKTLVAEILMLKEIICNKRNAIFVLPYVALVQEKIQSLTPFALQLNFLIEEYASEKGSYPPRKRRNKNSIYICTIEKAQSVINCLIELNRLDEIGLVVIDELHLLGENGGRGASLECLLTKVMHSGNNIQIIGMSATIGNLEEIGTFLDAELYVQNFRPVGIKEYLKCENEIWLIDYKEEYMFTDKKIVNYKYSNKALQIDPDCLGGLVMDVVPKDSCLIFCSSRKNCENVAILLTQVLFKSLETHRINEKDVLLKALETESGKLCPVLQKTVKFGVAYHHSGLTAEERRLVEEAFKTGVLCVICCTSTLAAGVNLPARRVILRCPYVGAEFLSVSRYKQMIGRAGRAGMGEIGESILICKKSDMEKVHDLLRSKMTDSLSSLHTELDRGINNLILSSVLLTIATTRRDIHKIMSKTLLKVQENKLGIDIKTITDTALTKLLKSDVLRVKQNKPNKTLVKLDTSIIFPSQSDDLCNDDSNQTDNDKALSTNKKNKRYITLVNNTELELCPLGRAAMKGSIDLLTANTLYEDLRKAQNSLMIVDHLHLLYLLTPYDVASQIKPVGTVYYDVVMSLLPHQMQVARSLGLNEASVDKLRAGFTLKSLNTKVVQRFYVTLMLHELWNRHSVFNVAEKYQVNRGTIQNLLSSASSFAHSVVRFCQELDEFWAFRDLFTSFGQKLTYCCASELEPLMELPFVKTGRAKQLYKAGYKTLQSVAKSKPEEMVQKIEHLSKRIASQIISAAKLLLLEKVENLRDEVEDVLDGLEM